MNPETNRQEKETQAYKKFMQVAKKVSYLQYGKWKIVPSVSDPLRKFTLEKETPWMTVKIQLRMESYTHRGDYTDSCYDYRAVLELDGIYRSTQQTHIKLKPRMAPKIIEYVDNTVVPKFYSAIEVELQRQDEVKKGKDLMQSQYDKIPNLIVKAPVNTWDIYKKGSLKNCLFDMTLEPTAVVIIGRISYEKMAEIAKAMGWGK